MFASSSTRTSVRPRYASPTLPRGEYATISVTRKGDQVAVGQFDPQDLGIQMPTSTKRKRKRR